MVVNKFINEKYYILLNKNINNITTKVTIYLLLNNVSNFSDLFLLHKSN